MITVGSNWGSPYSTDKSFTANDIKVRGLYESSMTSASQTVKTSGAESKQSEESAKDDDTAVILTLSKIQQYMSRSRQLEAESKEDDVTASGRQQIKAEINKINVVISNLNIGNDSDTVENMGDSIDMSGNLVSHSAQNIMDNAFDAFQTQTGLDNMEVYALLM